MTSRLPWRAPLLAAAALAAAAPAAGAATYEQISRATGTAGVGDPVHASVDGVASDTGLFGVFSTATGTGNPYFPDRKPYLRDTLRNRTTPLRADGEVIDVDRSERLLLTSRFDGSSGTLAFALARTSGAAPTPVASIPAFGFSNAELSGDGRTVAYSNLEQGTRFYDVASGRVTTPTPGFVGLDRFSLSDDAKVIAGWRYDEAAGEEGGVIIRGAQRTEVAARAHVSPDGRRAFYLVPNAAGTGKVLVTRTLATGAESRKALPSFLGNNVHVLWIAPDGGRVAIGLSTDLSQGTDRPTQPAQVLTLASGRWAAFGGAYAKDLSGDEVARGRNFTISRNGRYATLGFNDQVALVALEGQLLAGGDPLSASAYYGYTPTPSCFGVPPTSKAFLAQPEAWVPAPRKATLTVKSGATTLLAGAQNSQPPVITRDGFSPWDPAFTATVPLDGQPLTFTWSVVDHAGRTLKETYTVPGCAPFVPEPEDPWPGSSED